MKPYVWKEGMNEKEMRDGAYWERNLLALHYALRVNKAVEHVNKLIENQGGTIEVKTPPCGYYVHGEWSGWSRVISLDSGRVTFHVPDDFDLGDLPEIEPNWDGHSTEEKWLNVMKKAGCKL